MKDADMKNLEGEIFDKAVLALRILPEDVENALVDARRKEDHPYASIVLDAIVRNIGMAEGSPVPLCQDTGMFWVLVSIGRDAGPLDLGLLESRIVLALSRAVGKGFYRRSVVREPVFDRINTRDNMPAVINYETCDGSDVVIRVLLKGFGSENCTGLAMLRPTAGREGVVESVCDIVAKAGGKPCPPMFLGIGIGGTADRAAFLSKKAFFSKRDHADQRYSDLEKEILSRVNSLGIGAGGLGGGCTALDARILYESTHIAGLPVCVSISCWADRQFEVVLKGGHS